MIDFSFVHLRRPNTNSNYRMVLLISLSKIIKPVTIPNVLTHKISILAKIGYEMPDLPDEQASFSTIG